MEWVLSINYVKTFVVFAIIKSIREYFYLRKPRPYRKLTRSRTGWRYYVAKKTITRRPTISDVARAAGVAPSTVSHALNNKGYVDADTKARILRHVKHLGYRPNARARSLRTGGVRTVSLISTMPLGVSGGMSKLGFLMELAAATAEEAVKRGFALVLVPPQPEGGGLPALDIDGAIMVEPAEDDPQLTALVADNYPVVCLGRWPGHAAVPFVDLRSRETAELLLGHLRERGARRIAVMMGASKRTSYVETEDAYREQCAQDGQEPILVKLDERGGELAGRVAAADLMQRHPDIDGILALVDAFASGVVQAAQDYGWDIPGRLKIATRYDGLRAKLAPVPLTATDLHLDEVAAMGVELLSQIFDHPGQSLSLRPQMPGLVARESTARAGKGRGHMARGRH